MVKKNKVLNISKKLGLSHIGSCLSVLPILEEIYAKKKPEDKVILDNAHAHLAHLLFIQRFNVEKFIKMDIHCNRKVGCDASGGSLGHGIGIGIGFALANPDITVYVIVSDGSLQEGSDWEALRLKKLLKIDNLKVYANLNGSTALEDIDRIELGTRLLAFCKDIEIRHTDNGEGFEGVQGHYKVI